MDVLSRIPGAGVPVHAGVPFSGARDGASVQFYNSTVIEYTKMNGFNIYFVVGLSDTLQFYIG